MNLVILPITTIESKREIRSNGLIFTSNKKSETFQCIINLFIETMISDKDSRLDFAFTLIKNENVIKDFKKNLHLDPIICSWYKTPHFLKQLTSL